ncbi:MAG: cytochrome-c peroxidase [Flavobacteriales bacterium]
MKSKYIFRVLFSTMLGLIVSCSNDDDSSSSKLSPVTLEFEGLPNPNLPEDNPLTTEGIELGRRLFYEKALSKDESISCASCHAQTNAFSDTNQFSSGVGGAKGKRQAMAIFNMAWNNNQFFWDGRANLLRDQSIMPIQDHLEMNETLENVILKLNDLPGYKDRFNSVFGTSEISSLNISLALEQFMLSIVSNNSRYDKYKRGEISLTSSEERGRKLFFEDYNKFFPDASGADCAHCHSGANFENNEYMNNGLDALADQTDIGREGVTSDIMDKAKFKVTSLRNIELTPPYMHDGRLKTLDEVIEHYNSGIQLSPSVHPALRDTEEKGLFLDTQDKKDLIAFLKTLTDNTLATNPAYSNPF